MVCFAGKNPSRDSELPVFYKPRGMSSFCHFTVSRSDGQTGLELSKLRYFPGIFSAGLIRNTGFQYLRLLE